MQSEHLFHLADVQSVKFISLYIAQYKQISYLFNCILLPFMINSKYKPITTFANFWISCFTIW